VEHAQVVIDRTKEELAALLPAAELPRRLTPELKTAFDNIAPLPAAAELPGWLTPELVAILIERYSFETAGGPRRALSRRGLMRLLGDHRALRKDLIASLGKGGKKCDRALQDAIRALGDAS
jgi:hypothetical protein